MTGNFSEISSPLTFLLTRPLRDVTYLVCKLLFFTFISTHTPLAGRDMLNEGSTALPYISTHTPLAGRDFNVSVDTKKWIKFLLTRPLRDVTAVKTCWCGWN